eukprot:196082-Rhodomonas_salina.1
MYLHLIPVAYKVLPHAYPAASPRTDAGLLCYQVSVSLLRRPMASNRCPPSSPSPRSPMSGTAIAQDFSRLSSYPEPGTEIA